MLHQQGAQGRSLSCLRGLTVATLALLLAACGFQLRGSYQVPEALDPVEVRGPVSPLTQELVLALRSSDVQVVSDPKLARAVIRVLNEVFDRRVLSVDGTGKVVEFELTYRVVFDVVDPQGQPMMPRENLLMTRTHTNPDVETLGKREEELLIRSDMQRDLAERILSRIWAELG